MDDDVNDQHINVSFIISMAYNQAKAQNMLLIMFDPYFQNMKIKQDYVGNFVTIQIVVDYDTRIMHPLLLQAYTIWTLIEHQQNRYLLKMTTYFLGILYHMLMEFYKPWRMNCNYFQSYQHDQQKEKTC